MDIKEIKKVEIEDMQDFINSIYDYGHIFHLDPKLLDKPFNKIKEGMDAVLEMMDESFDM